MSIFKKQPELAAVDSKVSRGKLVPVMATTGNIWSGQLNPIGGQGTRGKSVGKAGSTNFKFTAAQGGSSFNVAKGPF